MTWEWLGSEMRLSIVDLGQVPAGGTCADALAHSVRLAQAAERAGYHRYWIAEHHGRGETFASSNPEVIVAAIAGATSTIRVGSGGVLLNHYSPFKVAETFRLLHALYPDRVDLGFGRADGLPVVDFALQKDRQAAPDPADRMAAMMAWLAQEEQAGELIDWLDGSFPPDHPFAEVALLPGVRGGPEPWLLGASTASAALAGRLGLRFCFAGFLNPAGAVAALRTYRHTFTTAGPGIATASRMVRPYTMLALNVVCGPTDAEADRMRASVEVFWQRARTGAAPRAPLTEPDEAVAELGTVPLPTHLNGDGWPRHLSGSPSRVREMLEELVAITEVDEVILQDLIARPGDRLRSYELIADAFDLARPVRVDEASETPVPS